MEWFKSLPGLVKVVIGLVLGMSLCVVCFLLILVIPLPVDEQTNPATELPAVTDTVTIVIPTLTPDPSPTPLPLLSCRDIENAKDDLTELQWDSYEIDVVGKEIIFRGSVTEVYSDGRVLIDNQDCNKVFTSFMLYGVSDEIAVNLSKGDILSGDGVVREVDPFISLSIRVDVSTIDQ